MQTAVKFSITARFLTTYSINNYFLSNAYKLWASPESNQQLWRQSILPLSPDKVNPQRWVHLGTLQPMIVAVHTSDLHQSEINSEQYYYQNGN